MRDDWLPKTALKFAKDSITAAEKTAVLTGTAAVKRAALDKLIEKLAKQVVLGWRKCARTVVGTAGSSARNGEQVDVLLQRPALL